MREEIAYVLYHVMGAGWVEWEALTPANRNQFLKYADAILSNFNVEKK